MIVRKAGEAAACERPLPFALSGVTGTREMETMKRKWNSDMIRPILYKMVGKCLTALAAVLLWDRFVNRGGAMSALRDGCMAAAIFLFVMAWFSYLKLDGVRVHHLLETQKKWPERHKTKDMVDFVDEHIVSFDELSDREQIVCKLVSSLLSGLIYLIPALAALLV